jgi:tight adherence protein B
MRLRTLALAAVALLASAATVAAPAAAAPGPVSISSIEVKSGKLVGLLGTSGGATIDPALTIDLAGKTYSVDAIASGQGSPVSRTAMLVVDTSGSMGTSGMATVRAAVAAFLRSVPGDVRVGLVSFSGTAKLNLAPTTDQGKVQSAVNALKADGETALYDAVAMAVQTLGTKGERSILLLSDGGDTASKAATQASAVASLKSAKVRAEAVSFKSSEGDTAALQQFASAGGGKVVSAANAGAVQSAFTSAAKTLASQLSFSLPLPEGVSGVQNVKVRGTAGGAEFATTATLDVGAGIPAKAKETGSAAGQPIEGPVDETVEAISAGSTVPVLGVPPLAAGAFVLVLLGVGGLVLGFAGGSFTSKRAERVQNIEAYASSGASAATSRRSRSATTTVSENLVFLGEKVMEGRESTGKTMARIEQADLPLRAGEWWVLRIVALVVCVVVSLLFLGGGLLQSVFAAVLGLVVGVFGPAFVLRFLANRRAKKFESQLPDVLTLVASSLSTGFSLPQALDAVAKDAAEPAAKEFARALAETRIGADISDSLERMATRMNSDNMRWTSMAIRIQREVGGNLADTLRTTAKTLREREELGRHVKALSAEGRLSAYILIALPIGIFFYTMKTNREYIELLWSHPIGWGMIAAGLVSLGIGVFWMRKVVDVKV